MAAATRKDDATRFGHIEGYVTVNLENLTENGRAWTCKRRNNRRHHGNRRTLALEGLEPRQLLSAAAGGLSTDPKDPSIARIGAGLAGLWDQYQTGVAGAHSIAAASSSASASVGQQLPTVGSSVVINAVASGSVTTLASNLTQFGIVVTGKAGVMVSALLPVSANLCRQRLTSLAFATPSHRRPTSGP